MTPASRRVAGETPAPLIFHASCECGFEADLPVFESTCPMAPIDRVRRHAKYECTKLRKPKNA